MGRFLTGLGPLNYHTTRVRTADPSVLLSFLDGLGASVHVAGPCFRRRADGCEAPYDERLANLFLRSELGATHSDAIGFVAGRFLEPDRSLVVFGHQVPINFDVATFALIALVLVAISIGSAVALLNGALRLRPTESIREEPAVESPRSSEVVL